ncbi:acyl-CoA dehydrogenase family protein [Paenibacillus sp. NPDC058071]|uniref:acyl-CoA dehydrogenase family protein n=1 Tax=Paenibacillus sp. NPDC058071 TaxID=3346326 RepID=UPI0036DC5EDA
MTESLLISSTDSNVFVIKAIELSKQLAVDAAKRDREGGAAYEQLNLLKDSGLLKVIVSPKYGGDGQPWSVVLRIVRELAKEDASLAHLYGFHTLNILAARWNGTEKQQEYLETGTVCHNWFWGNSVNYYDRRLTGKREGDGYRIHGEKGFSSGSPGSDRLVISWRDEADDSLLFAAIPTDKAGITVHDDWDGIGQRQTGSGTVQFNQVYIDKGELLDSKERIHLPYATLTPILSKSVLTNVYVGSAFGAIEAAKEYTVNHTRPYIASGVDKAIEDPWIKRQYGELWIQAVAAASLTDNAIAVLDSAWNKGMSLTEQERGEAAVIVSAANVHAGNTALEVTSRIFEVMGARSATRKNGFDRFWRNVRTHTLHDPVEYKLRSVGDWVLTGAYPSTQYS